MREKLNQLGKKRIAIISAIVIVLILALIFILLYRKGIRATTMRLLRYEGTVTMEDNGNSQAVKENLRLKSGNSLDTAVASLVSIGLDDTKIVTMDELSRSEFNQKGKYLNLNLTKGSIFFEVDKPLAENETFEIETSTMIVGIRGTSGWVSVSGENESLIITDGKVHVIGTNPVTGEVKEIDVKAGQRISVYLYNDREVDSIMFVLEDITERDLPEFVLRMLRENPELLDKVVRETGWDKPWILGITDAEEPEEEPEDKPDQSDPVITDPVEPEPVVVADLEPDDEEPVPAGNAQNNDADLPPVAVPTVSALERQIQAALAQVVEVTADGDYILVDGTDFDPDYYAERYPDVVAIYGDKDEELLAHYVAHGQEEGRFANKTEEDDKLLADAIANAPAPNDSAATTTAAVVYNNTAANTAVQAQGSNYYSLGGVDFDYSNGVLSVVPTTQANSVTMPSYLEDTNHNITPIALADLSTNYPQTVNNVDISNFSPSISEMASFFGSVYQPGAGIMKVTSGNVYIENALYGMGAASGPIANVTGDADKFMDIASQLSTNLVGVCIPSQSFGIYDYQYNSQSGQATVKAFWGTVTFTDMVIEYDQQNDRYEVINTGTTSHQGNNVSVSQNVYIDDSGLHY